MYIHRFPPFFRINKLESPEQRERQYNHYIYKFAKKWVGCLASKSMSWKKRKWTKQLKISEKEILVANCFSDLPCFQNNQHYWVTSHTANFPQSNIFFGQFFRIMGLFLSILTMMFLPTMFPTNWFTFVDNSKQEPIANPLPVLHLQFLHWLWTNRQTGKHETFPTEFLNFSLLSYNTKY